VGGAARGALTMYRKAYAIVMVLLLAMFGLVFVLMYKQLKQLSEQQQHQRQRPAATSPAR
jgi:uncharacterized membrane protein